MKVDSIGGNDSVLPVADSQASSKLHTTPATAQAVTAINSARLFGQDNELTFAMDRATKRTVVRLVDRKTGDVIRQVPSETILRLAETLVKPGQ